MPFHIYVHIGTCVKNRCYLGKGILTLSVDNCTARREQEALLHTDIYLAILHRYGKLAAVEAYKCFSYLAPQCFGRIALLRYERLQLLQALTLCFYLILGHVQLAAGLVQLIACS